MPFSKKKKINRSHIVKNIQGKFSLLRQNITKSKDKYPFFGNLIEFGYQNLYNLIFVIEKFFQLFKARLKYGKLYYTKLYWTNPDKIQNHSKIRLKWHYYLHVLGGDWDKPEVIFENTLYFQSFRQRFKEGKNWEDTEYYKKVLNQLLSGKEYYGIKSKEAWDQRFKKADKVYYSIKKYNFKRQRDLPYSMRRFKFFNITSNLDEITIDIGRDGELLLKHGKNRLAIVKVLNISKIPIIIIARHKEWMKFRSYLIYFVKKFQCGALNEVITHPDLQNVPYKQNDIEFNVIKENTTSSKGTLLDLSANFGYFCIKFEEKGFDTFAVEDNKIKLYFLKKIKQIENKKFKVIQKPIFEYKKDEELEFDVVLAFDVFHRYLETEEKFLGLIRFLKRLKVKELFFCSLNHKEFIKKNYYKLFSPNKLANFIIENSCLNNAKFIGKTKSSKLIFKIFL